MFEKFSIPAHTETFVQYFTEKMGIISLCHKLFVLKKYCNNQLMIQQREES